MSRLTHRYSQSEWEELVELIYPEERWMEFSDQPWTGEGFRHYRDPNIVCIEHFRPKEQPTAGLRGASCVITRLR